MKRPIIRTSDQVSDVVLGLAADLPRRRGIQRLFTRHSPFHMTRLLEMLCDGVRQTDLVLAMECGVCLALLHPVLSSDHRRRIVTHLLPLLQSSRHTRRKTAVVYALQYSQSSQVRAHFTAMAQSRAGRLILQDVLGSASPSVSRPSQTRRG